MKTTAIKYLDAFEKKNLFAISEMLDANVTLRDWEISASGIDSVLAATARIFYSAESISINIKNIIQEQTFVAVEVIIEFNRLNSIHVVDIIEFNSIGKICAIKAFKG
jgi:hypothetical protein